MRTLCFALAIAMSFSCEKESDTHQVASFSPAPPSDNRPGKLILADLDISGSIDATLVRKEIEKQLRVAEQCVARNGAKHVVGSRLYFQLDHFGGNHFSGIGKSGDSVLQDCFDTNALEFEAAWYQESYGIKALIRYE